MRRRLTAARFGMVGAAALAFGALAGCGGNAPGATTMGAFTISAAPTAAACDYKTQWVPPAGNVGLDDLAITGPGQGWSVGALTTNGYTGAPTGVIYRLNNGQWSRLPQTYPNAELSAIAMDSPTDGWAASKTVMTTGHNDRALVLHYTDGQWRQVDIPALDAVLKGSPGTAGQAIMSLNIQMFGPNAGWMFADTNVSRDFNNPSSRLEVVILHYIHGVWTLVPQPDTTISTQISGFAAPSADEAWVSFTDYGVGVYSTRFAHYINGAWSMAPQVFPGTAGGITMTGPTNGWASAENDNTDAPELFQYSGSAWRAVALPARMRAEDWIRGPIALYPDSSAAWFVLIPSHGAEQIVQYASGQWTTVAWPYADALPDHVIADSAGDLWGIGNIAHQRGCPPAFTVDVSQGVFYHQRQGEWSEQVLV